MSEPGFKLKILQPSIDPRTIRIWLNGLELTGPGSGLTELSFNWNSRDVTSVGLKLLVGEVEIDAQTLAYLSTSVKTDAPDTPWASVKTHAVTEAERATDRLAQTVGPSKQKCPVCEEQDTPHQHGFPGVDTKNHSLEDWAVGVEDAAEEWSHSHGVHRAVELSCGCRIERLGLPTTSVKVNSWVLCPACGCHSLVLRVHNLEADGSPATLDTDHGHRGMDV